PSLIVVLTVSALKLLGVTNSVMVFIVPVAIAAGVAYAVRAGRKAREARSERPAQLEAAR
ncbi:MAG TPA: hypothetical protein VGK73_28260, partial [Polyangiaceae bacterium]